MIIFRLKRIQQSASSLAVLRELVIYMPVPFDILKSIFRYRVQLQKNVASS